MLCHLTPRQNCIVTANELCTLEKKQISMHIPEFFKKGGGGGGGETWKLYFQILYILIP